MTIASGIVLAMSDGTMHSSFARLVASLVLPVAIVLACLATACSSASSVDEPSALTHVDTSVSTTIHTDYGMTTFGGPGDYQPLACGGNSETSQPWYVASSQRYGCDVHLQLTTANGKCVVVQTEDVGPAAYVEADAGKPILDSSPSVSEYLFGEGELGWSDNRGTSAYVVRAVVTDLPLGPCANGTIDSDAGSGSSSGGATCATDGDCNPGATGSDLICVAQSCVPGCHTSAQCPGATSCHSGTCS